MGVYNLNLKIEFDRQKIMLAGLLIAIGVLGRLILHDFFNGISNPFAEFGFLDVFFVVALVAIFSGVLLGKYYTFIVPLCVLIITDIYYAFVDPINAAIYTSWLFLFTLSGYVFIALIGAFTRKKSKLNMMFVPKLLGAGVVGIVIYDLWTNFGFWLAYSKLGYYPQTIEGLGTVYLGGVPFMVWHLLSTSVALAVIIIPLMYLKKHEILTKEFVVKPIEKYVITGATVFLIVASILTAMI
jgi:hypothetical protein